MKKLIILLILILCAPVYAEDVQLARMSSMVYGGNVEAAAGCNESTDYVGSKASDAAAQAVGAGIMYCFLHTPSCYGALKTGYALRANDTEATHDVCVYKDDGDDAADSGDDLEGCHGNLTSSTNGWVSQAMDGGTLTSGNYWVCVYTDDASSNSALIDTGTGDVTIYYKTLLTTPPSTLENFVSTTGRVKTVYVTIGE